MVTITSYIIFILLSINGQPTGYTFTYSSNQNTSSSIQEDGSNISNEDNTKTYVYGG